MKDKTLVVESIDLRNKQKDPHPGTLFDRERCYGGIYKPRIQIDVTVRFMTLTKDIFSQSIVTLPFRSRSLRMFLYYLYYNTTLS